MNGAAHYDRAEQLMESAGEWVDENRPDQAELCLAEAQVHATLALAAATAAPLVESFHQRMRSTTEVERDAECWAMATLPAPVATIPAGPMAIRPFAAVPR